MASISNTGKTMTVAFTVEEKQRIEARAGEDWKWQIPEFTIDDSGVGHLKLRADMINGRKMGLMSTTPEERWMLVVPSTVMPLAPYFNKVPVEAVFGDDDKLVEFILPRELPALKERQLAALAASKPKVKKTPITKAKPEVAAPQTSTALVVPTPQQRNGSNLTLLIEGKSFRFEVPIEARLRIMSDLAQFAVVSG